MRGLMTKSVYDIIKRQNGEAFAKAIRNYDSGIFDVPDLARIVRYAGRNALPLLPFLESLKEIQIEEVAGHLSPFELLELAGYDAYYADTLEKQNAIQKYFESHEKLCTFKDANRYKKYYIINAVKKNVQEIKRENFYGKEQRQDEYGTSVISIQMFKTGGFISIKNRYNHTVPGCDNTFDSNPDNIIMGLSSAIKKYFGVDFSSQKVPLSKGYTYQNNQIIKYILETNNVYFGEDFYVKDGVVHQTNKDYQLMIRPFIVDLKDRKILNPTGVTDGFVSCFEDEIQKGVLQVQNQNGMKVLLLDGKPLLYARKGTLKRLYFSKLVEMSNMLKYFEDLETVDAPCVKIINEWCFEYLENLKKVNLPSLETMYAFSFKGTNAEVYAPKMQEKGVYFLGSLAIDIKNKKIKAKGGYNSEFLTFLQSIILNNNVSVKQYLDGVQELMINEEPFFKFKNGKLVKIALENITQLDAGLIHNLPGLEEVSLPNVAYVGSGNFNKCPKLKKVFLPKAIEMRSSVFCDCESLEEIDCPNVRYLEWQCVNDNPNLKRFLMPELRETKDYCFNRNGFEELNLPCLEKVKSNCFCHLPKLKKLDLPFLSYTKERCFCYLNEIEELTLPSLISYWGEDYLSNNPKLKKVRLNEIEVIRARSFLNCPNLQVVVLDKAEVILENSLCELPALETVIAPEIDSIYENVLSHCEKLKSVYMPHLRLIKRDNFYNTPLLSCLYAPNAKFKEAENLETQKPTVIVQKRLPASMEKYIQQFDFER